MRSESPALAARMPAQVDDLLAEVDAPAPVIELDLFERNLAAMAEAVRGKRVRLRPHAKSHKCPEIAKRQIAQGVGMTAEH
jgi:D-serine deaminase-like pyridoxal phosphate-dependent protein